MIDVAGTMVHTAIHCLYVGPTSRLVDPCPRVAYTVALVCCAMRHTYHPSTK